MDNDINYFFKCVACEKVGNCETFWYVSIRTILATDIETQYMSEKFQPFFKSYRITHNTAFVRVKIRSKDTMICANNKKRNAMPQIEIS